MTRPFSTRRDSAAFAQAIVAPYRRRDVIRRRLSLPMLIRRAAMITTISERHLHVTASSSWRLQIVVNRSSLVSQRAAPPRVVPPVASQVDRARPTPTVALVLARWKALPERMIARATRVDAPAAPSPRQAQRAPVVAGTPALPRMSDGARLPVVRPAAAIAVANALRSPLAAAAPALPARDSRVNPVTPPRTPSLSAIEHGDLQRLASRVISSIDDRITAARERLGSV